MPTLLVSGALAVWTLAGIVVSVRRPHDRLGPLLLTGSALAIGAAAAAANDRHTAAAVLLALLPAVAFHFLVTLPDGRAPAGARRWATAAGYALGAVLGALAPRHGSMPDTAWYVAWWVVATGAALPASNRRYQRIDAADRRRMRWIGWALVVFSEIVLAVVALRLLASWPPHPGPVVVAGSTLIALAVVAGLEERLAGRVDRLLSHTVTLAGLTALVIATYVLVVVVRGRALRPDERSLLLLSMFAAIGAGLAFLPLRERLVDAANRLVYGQDVAPDDALRTWGSRLTRAIPLEELLLQLTESLRRSMSLARAEVYTGRDGRYDLAAGVPHRSRPAVLLGDRERQVVARAGVSGGTWLDVWMPTLAPGDTANTRAAPIVHGGELLGLIVLTRDARSEVVDDEADRIVVELARQVALALHTAQLDTALQASLLELQRTNLELERSRLRIVTAGDEQRRSLERNLHDGAQQHLVAMAVKLRIAEDLVQDDPIEATKVIEELRDNLKDAIDELRALAHGIFPPLLSSGGLPEALPAAAARAARSTSVDTTGLRRYSPEVESTVYFCCLEAMQNAGKHAGEHAAIAITVGERDGELCFEVTDDGAGFDLDGQRPGGHGFVNMGDRLGAVGGRLEVDSALGRGTTVRGLIPVP